jgi:hypothetical protein
VTTPFGVNGIPTEAAIREAVQDAVACAAPATLAGVGLITEADLALAKGSLTVIREAPVYPLATFSQLNRAMACELSNVLPGVDVPTGYAQAGTSRHRFLQRVTELVQDPAAIVVKPALAALPATETEPAVEATPAETRCATLEEARELALNEEEDDATRAILELIPVESLGLQDVAAEVAFAFNLLTGEARELGRGMEREYGTVGPHEIVGTIDRVGFIGQDGLAIADYKGRAHAKHPTKDAQFLTATLAGVRVYRRDWAEIEVIRLIDDEPRREKGTVDVVDLDLHELKLKTWHEKVLENRETLARTGQLPKATVDSHCTYCPSFRYCPAQGSLARAVLLGEDEEVAGVVKVGKAYLTEANAGRIRQLVSQGRKLLDLLDEASKDFSRQTPFPLNDGSGRWYGVNPDSETRQFVDGKKAAEALKTLFGEHAMAAATVEVSWEGINRATRAKYDGKPPRGELTKHEKAAEDLLVKQGLVRIVKGGKVAAYRPKEEK